MTYEPDIDWRGFERTYAPLPKATEIDQRDILPSDRGMELLAETRSKLPATSRAKRHFGAVADNSTAMARAREMTADYHARIAQFACIWPGHMECEFCDRFDRPKEGTE